MDYERIESEARRLQREVYSRRELLFSTPPPLRLLFQPDVAARVLGLEYEYRESIGGASGKRDGETAGLLDRRRGVIVVSTRFAWEEQRFTGAHECGHVVLHEWAGERYAHRDRPTMNGLTDQARLPAEREADYFGACYLAPRRLVAEEFAKRFGSPPLVLDETLVFHLRLDPKAERRLLTSAPGSLDLAVELARCERLDGRSFPSLAREFGMSRSAMAIRLRELGLVKL